MKNNMLYIILFMAAHQIGSAQINNASTEDALIISGDLSLRGRWQTGNLNQISLMPNGNISVSDSFFLAEWNLNYHFLRVNGFDAKKDLWNNVLLQYGRNRIVFPSIHVVAGYATSFKIDHSIITGIGLGTNVHEKSRSNFLQVHVYGAYLNFQYEEEEGHESLGIGTRLKSKLPLNDIINIQWELSSYQSLKDGLHWGGSNLLVLNFQILNNLSFQITHQTYYNNKTTSQIKKTNTEMLFGIQYNFTNTLFNNENN